MLGAAAAHEVGGVVELLAPQAVRTGVIALVQIATIAAGPPQPFDAGSMPGISTGADEVVERDPERVAEGGELVSVSIDERPGGLAGRLGGEHVLERVLVGPAKEPDRLAQGAVEIWLPGRLR